MSERIEYLECQSCGEKLEFITPKLRNKMIAEPYSYVRYCFQCSTYEESGSERFFQP